MNDYIIKKGDNLIKIAKEYGTTVKELQKLNNIKNPNKIIAGKTLKLPEGVGTTIEHTEQTYQDDAAKKAREEAHQKEVARINELKKAQEINKMSEVTVTGKAPKKEVAKSEYNVEELISKEIEKRHLKNVNISYWAPKIDHVASEFDISPSILTSIIAREAAFRPNVIGRNNNGEIIGRGAMGQTGIAIKDFFPKQGRYELYNQLDSKLVDDILFKKDANGNVIKNEKGESVLKYSSHTELLKECAKDDELSIKIGALSYKFNFVKQVAKETGRKIPAVIADLKSGKLELPKETNEKCIKQAIRGYNGSYLANSYMKDVVDSLQRANFNFAQPIIKKS